MSSKDTDQNKISSETNLNKTCVTQPLNDVSPISIPDTIQTTEHIIQDSLIHDEKNLTEDSLAIEETKDTTFDKSDVSNVEEVYVTNDELMGNSHLDETENGEFTKVEDDDTLIITNDITNEKLITPNKRKSNGKFINEDSS